MTPLWCFSDLHGGKLNKELKRAVWEIRQLAVFALIVIEHLNRVDVIL